MSRASAGARRRGPRVTAATLGKLAPERLAELLAAAAKADPALKRALTLEVMSEAEDLADETDRQLDRMRTAKSRLNAARAGKLARELERLLDTVGSKLGALDPAAAAQRFVNLLELAADVLPRRTSEARPLVEVFASVGGRLAEATQRASASEQVQLVQPIYAVLLADTLGIADSVPAQVSSALQADGRRLLRELVETDLAAPASGSKGASALRSLQLTAVLGDLADAEGDVDGFIAAQARRDPALRDHVGSACRLFAAGRTLEALQLLDRAPVGAATSGPAVVDLRIQLLDPLGRRDEAQEERWRHFRAALSVDALRQHLKRLPGFDEVERQDEALTYVMGHPDATAALAFLIAWPDHRRAAALVRARQDRLKGDAQHVLGPAADALAQKDPLAASLLLRSMIQTSLQSDRRATHARAGLLLAECSTLAVQISDWEGRPDHPAFVARIRSSSRRAPAFWKAVAIAG